MSVSTLLTVLLACASPPSPPATEPPALLQTHRWEWEGQTGTAWVVSFPRDATVDIVPSDDVVPLTTIAPDDAGPWALLNGGFYEQAAMGLVVSDGQTQSALTERGGSGVLVYDGLQARVIPREAWPVDATEALQSIDRLVVDGQSVVRRREGAPQAARSAVVMSQDELCLVLHAADASFRTEADGTVFVDNPYGPGMPLWAFADWLITELDATYALNMDGGLSTNLLVRVGDRRFALRGVGGTINGVLVRPRAH